SICICPVTQVVLLTVGILTLQLPPQSSLVFTDNFKSDSSSSSLFFCFCRSQRFEHTKIIFLLPSSTSDEGAHIEALNLGTDVVFFEKQSKSNILYAYNL